MAQEERPGLPDRLKPWYYQDWFLFPTFVFWPLWPVLIIRSPWHNGVISGAVAWAMIFAGGYLIYLRMQLGGTVAYSTLMFILPGVVLTLVSQAHWLRYRRVVQAAAREISTPLPPPPPANPGRSRRSRRRRASRRS
ncbi:MAG: hypothetical protein ACE5Q6_17235 [Dehalococcoidia bacterium]